MLEYIIIAYKVITEYDKICDVVTRIYNYFYLDDKKKLKYIEYKPIRYNTDIEEIPMYEVVPVYPPIPYNFASPNYNIKSEPIINTRREEFDEMDWPYSN